MPLTFRRPAVNEVRSGAALSAAAFTRLFDEYAAGLYRYLAGQVGVWAAEDLVAETFLLAWAQRDGYDPDRAAPRAWLYGIATNLARRYHRQQERASRAAGRVAGRQLDDEAHDQRVAERVDAQVRAAQLAGALALLAPGDREVLLLSSWAGLNTVEIAAALSIPEGTVRSRLHRARRWLRAHAPSGGTEGTDG
jgi:RNA polymerase sigma factor (sigma-70 family)